MKNVLQKVVKKLAGPRAPVTVKIGNYMVGKKQPVFVIAEIGINHNGSVEIAKQLIDVAADAGCQAVKFQKRTVDKVYSPEKLAKPRVVARAVLENAIRRGVLSPEAVKRLKDSDYAESRDGDLKYALEFTEAEYRDIFDYANMKGLVAFASPWDVGSVDVLDKLGVPCHKIASASLTDRELLKRVHESGKPVILSTGMSTMDEVLKAIELLGTTGLILLHTVSTYPSEDNEVNLSLISELKRLFPDVPVGYSGHEKGIAISLAAATLGARVIERHVTLDKTMFGSDQSASIEPDELKALVKDIRSVEHAFGRPEKKIQEREIPIKEKLRKS